jgi:regulator of sigma E protease
MPDWILFLLSVVVLLGILILVHEWGHFAVAKLFGVRVDIFSVGFGPRLWGWKRGATDYRVSAFPLGGYVKMAGDNPVEERTGAPEEFLSKARWQRAIIALAGPGMNVALAFALVAGLVYAVGTPYPAYLDQQVEVVAVPEGSLAAGAGIRPGDRIAEISGIKNPTWRLAEEEVSKAASGQTLQLVLERGEEKFPVTLTISERVDATRVLGYAPIPAVVEVVARGAPADKGGVRANDEIIGVNGKRITVWPQFVEAVRGSGGQTIRVQVRRGGRERTLEITPILNPVEKVYQIGIHNRTQVAFQPVGFLAAMQYSVEGNVTWMRQILENVSQLVQGRLSVKSLGGPLEIARQSGQAAKRGWQDFLNLMAFISVNLAILNLLPIPILDGGHILMLSIEGVLRRDLSLAVKERFVQVGLVFLLVVFAIVMYNDVLKFR